MKPEARIIGIDDGPYLRGKKCIIVGVVFRGGLEMDGLLSTFVKIDGADATKNIVTMINNSKWKSILQAVLFKGVAVAGFNVVDMRRISKETGLPVIVVMRYKPNPQRMISALIKLKMPVKAKIVQELPLAFKVGSLWVQSMGARNQEVRALLKLTCVHGNIPEPLRIAHIIAGGIVDGESRGRA